MEHFKVLDCTLRDGGYVNNWNFGENTIVSIISKLVEAGIDIIECGFLSQKKETSQDKSIFGSVLEFNNLLSKYNYKDKQIACMINYGEYDINDIPSYNNIGLDTIRVAFHKSDMDEALCFCRQIKDKGYNVFIQPMVTVNYTDWELKRLIDQSNEINPIALYIVDSFGTMGKDEVSSLFFKFHTQLNQFISIGFHSHNNLQLSFSNAQELINIEECSRDIIIDSSVFGMGRGAGNLCTELLTLHLNKRGKNNKSYNIIPLLEIIDDYINPIFIKTPWGYSVPFYIASINNCHPNYASYLTQKQTLGVKSINIILSQIPLENKLLYNQKIIEELYIRYQECLIDDSDDIEKIKKLISKKNLLILAPGKSIEQYKSEIKNYISKYLPQIWSINFIPEDYSVDFLFLNNLKRFSSIKNIQEKTKDINVVSTSNISGAGDEFLKINYMSLINLENEEIDNAGIMLLRFFENLGVKNVSIAGYDGFSNNPHENYYSEKMINTTTTEFISNRNACIKKQLSTLKRRININFLTPSLYNE